MNTTLTIVNDNLDLESQYILVYLKPQGNNSDWMTSAWEICSPQKEGGSAMLPAINNTVGAYVVFADDMQKTAYQDIPPQYMANLVENGNEICLNAPVLNGNSLTNTQSGVSNTTILKDAYPVWCLNGNSVCKPANPMFNTGFSSFELFQSVYLTVGSSIETENFKVQNWAQLTEIELPSNLVSANIVASVDLSTNKPIFVMQNQVYR